jgi:peptidoglycan DL-endopeptidase CwlO
MPSALVTALAAPIREVQSLVGPGPVSAVTAELAGALHSARTALQEVSASAGQAWRQTAESWTGPGADAAAQVITTTVAGAEDIAERIAHIGSSADSAGAAVARAHERLREIVESFEARAAAMEPHLDSPGMTEELLAEARRSLAEAVTVVEELRAELDGQAAALPGPTTSAAAPAPTTSAAPPATAPAGFGSAMPPVPSMGSGLGGSAGPASSAGGFGSLLRDLAESPPPQAPVDTPDAAAFGNGVAVRLPDGSTVMAPNAMAASAVRHALTQLGVPYDWGGTTPGVGLDCSGLTQWAYSEAGLTIPRLAQEQDVGTAVDAGSLRPGDLAVWDGHVAMIVGNGQMIEAGDPVQVSSIRTTNAGQGFQGFWRPTA